MAKTKLLFDAEVDAEWVEAGWPEDEEKGEGYEWFRAEDIVKLFASIALTVPWEDHPFVDGEEIREVVSF